jgi:hypothetical protein
MDLSFVVWKGGGGGTALGSSPVSGCSISGDVYFLEIKFITTINLQQRAALWL